MSAPRVRLPHPLILLVFCIALAAVLTWVLPAGEYERREDRDTGRQVVVAGTYHAVAASPVEGGGPRGGPANGRVAAGAGHFIGLLVGGGVVLFFVSSYSFFKKKHGRVSDVSVQQTACRHGMIRNETAISLISLSSQCATWTL